MDMQQGMLCELTNAKADFDNTCPNYDEDTKEKAKSDRIRKGTACGAFSLAKKAELSYNRKMKEGVFYEGLAAF